VTRPYQAPAGRRKDHQASPNATQNDITEISEPYELLYPEDERRPGRPAYLIVVDQLRDWQAAPSPSLAELLESGRTRQPEPDLEAEP
jgi:hypothetical protein